MYLFPPKTRFNSSSEMGTGRDGADQLQRKSCAAWCAGAVRGRRGGYRVTERGVIEVSWDEV